MSYAKSGGINPKAFKHVETMTAMLERFQIARNFDMPHPKTYSMKKLHLTLFEFCAQEPFHSMIYSDKIMLATNAFIKCVNLSKHSSVKWQNHFTKYYKDRLDVCDVFF